MPQPTLAIAARLHPAPDTPDAPDAPDACAELLARVAARDRAAFAALYRLLERPAFNLAMQLTGRHALAEDALQEAFLRVWTSAGDFRPGNARAWVLRIVAHQGLKRMRSRKSCGETLPEANEPRLERIEAHGAAPEAALEREETLAALRQGLDALPQLNRQLVALYYGAGFTQSEIAKALAMPARTVSFKLDEALKRLRTSLARAGMAAALPLLDAGRFGPALGALHRPPAKLLDRILPRLSRPGPDASARPATHRGAVAGHAPALAGAAILACAAACGWACLHAAPATPAATAEPASAPLPDEAPAFATPAGLPADPCINASWHFGRGPSPDFPPHPGKWTWKRLPSGNAGMATPTDRQEGLLLPMRFPALPQKIVVHGRFLDLRKPNNASAYWITGHAVLPHKTWGKVLRVQSRCDVVLYLFDSYMVREVGGQVQAVHAYERPYPTDRIAVAFANMLIWDLSVHTIGDGEIPEAYRRPTDLIVSNRLNEFNDFPASVARETEPDLTPKP